MNSFDESEVNVKGLQTKLLNYLHNYITSSHKREDRYNLTIRVSKEVYETFVDVCRRLRLTPGKSRGNLVIEGFMQFFNDLFKASPTYVQTTLFYKPQISLQQKVEVNIAQKIELKLIKEDFKRVLESLEKGKGNREFYIARLRELLPKAIRLYQRSADEEIKKLFEKVEKMDLI
ncbi:MAG: hypothetical protein QXU45_08865 [Candidatus Bathyarchaeia archaeon]